MTRIIGHRGARGLVLENTLASFKKAIELGVDAIEFDVHTTYDGQYVVCHDKNLARVSEAKRRDTNIEDLTYYELQQIELMNGEAVPLLKDVLELAHAHNIKAVVELKSIRNPEVLCALLDEFGTTIQAIASFNHRLIETIRGLRPQYHFYLAEARHPFEIIHTAIRTKASGIDLNYKLLNPLTYWQIRRRHLDLMVYTVNNPLIERFIHFFYPAVQICTDVPDKFTKRSLS